MMAVNRIEVSGQLNAPDVLFPGKNRDIHRIASWMGPELVWAF